MTVQDARQHPAKLVLDLPIGLGLPTAAEAGGDLLPGRVFNGRIVGRNPASSSRRNGSTGSLPISSNSARRAALRTRRHSSDCRKVLWPMISSATSPVEACRAKQIAASASGASHFGSKRLVFRS